MYKKIIFLMAASIILVPSIHAFSLRLNVPVSGSYEVEGCSECSPKSGGYSIRGIFGMFGLLDILWAHLIGVIPQHLIPLTKK